LLTGASARMLNSHSAVGEAVDPGGGEIIGPALTSPSAKKNWGWKRQTSCPVRASKA
jgi:hypothetical protein